MLVLRALQGVVAGRGAVTQPLSEHLILGDVVVVKQRDHVPELIPDESRFVSVARCNGADQTGEVVELAMERAMNHRHLERGAWDGPVGAILLGRPGSTIGW